MPTHSLRRGQRIELEARELVAGGDALCRHGSLPVFVAGLFPGDIAIVEITEARKNFARGEWRKRIFDSPLRRAAPCPIADSCGGCDWTALRLDVQLEAKKKILDESLRRVGKFDTASLPEIKLHPSPLNYRLRSRLHYDKRKRAIGFYAAGTHHVVPLTTACEVVGPGVIDHLDELTREAGRANASVETFENGRHFWSGIAERTESGVALDVGSDRYQLSTAAFFQVNRHLLRQLLERIETHGGSCWPRRLAFDLYGGVGFFALPLARTFDSVVTVESSAVSHRYAKLNTAHLRNVEADSRSVEAFLSSTRQHPDFIMIDPPRAGMSPKVMEIVADSPAEKICYLSCDPVTFARDASRLARSGWIPTSLDLLDLFPNTHHIETLSLFERAEKRK